MNSTSSSTLLEGNMSIVHLIHIHVSLFASKQLCSSALRVIHFIWHICTQLQHFRLYEWLRTRLSQNGQHVIVLTSCKKCPSLISTVEINHEISSHSWLNSYPPDSSDSPEYNIQEVNIIPLSKCMVLTCYHILPQHESAMCLLMFHR